MSKPKKSNRFKYNLSSVLKVREIREKQEQDKFIQAEKKLIEEAEKEKKIKDFQNEKYKELRGKMDAGATIDFSEIILRKTHLEIVKEQVLEQERLKQEAERKKEDQRQKLVQASIDKQVMEKDKDNKKDAWKKIMDKEAGKFLDDISTIGHERQRREKNELDSSN